MTIKKLIDVVAWDNGFGMDKFKVNLYSIADIERGGVEPRYEQFSFQSVYCNYTFPKLKPAASHLVEYDRGLNKNKLIIEYNDVTYAVGPFAIEQDVDGGAQSFDKKKFEKPTEVIKLLVSLAHFFPIADEIHIDKLMVGLSLEAFEMYHEKLSKQYTNFTANYKVLTTGGVMREVLVKITEATCIPQGQGALYDAILGFGKAGTVLPSLEGNRLLHQRFGVLDVGDKTIDGFVTTGIETVQNTEFWLTHGLSQAYEKINNKIGVPANLIELHYLNKSRLHYENDYEFAELESLCKAEFMKIADEIFDKIDEKWNKHYPRMDFILLCGGGGIAIQEQLFERLKVHTKAELKLANDAQFANVSGYYKLGMLTMLKQRQKIAFAGKIS